MEKMGDIICHGDENDQADKYDKYSNLAGGVSHPIIAMNKTPQKSNYGAVGDSVQFKDSLKIMPLIR